MTGKGRLTQLTIDHTQGNYGQASQKSTGSLEGMQGAVWAIFHHMIGLPFDIPLTVQHRFCPKGEGSWCKCNANLEK